ncbi:ubiquitin-like protein Pup [Spongisporangium articulatum]|uniref:Prokaryotic ubiquitin-like protein Pup n=1 Tax=Spongisporangium articulatum TaxID=3362603 RepID=A0ABW8ARV7_9ACTN
MAGQEQQRTTRHEEEPDDAPPPAAAPAAQSSTVDEDVDAILDEIDEVLENNAEEFVKGFVQKGGQ